MYSGGSSSSILKRLVETQHRSTTSVRSCMCTCMRLPFGPGCSEASIEDVGCRNNPIHGIVRRDARVWDHTITAMHDTTSTPLPPPLTFEA